ncbi:hypothetical protein NECID01_0398 [Nematocida sp. AWRm77]|nr:hypothetical protein NECID01_0398 [Nematocida sp. AWRm77]
MVKYGVLGKHSADIVFSEAFSTYDLSYDTFWSLLYAFLDQTGFEYRHTHPSPGQTMVRIEKADAWPKQINEEYTGLPQETKMRTVLHSRLGLARSSEKKRNEAVLEWMLLNIGGSAVDIQYSINITSEGLSEHKTTIQNLIKENKKGASVHVEGLTLDVEYDSIISLRPLLQLIPDLSRLKFINKRPWKYKELLSSLISTLSSCTSLKALTITEYILESEEVSILADSLPNIEQLSIWCKPLERTAMDSLKKCVQLEKLEIGGWYQPSDVVQAIVTHLLLLRELRIRCYPLEPAVVEAFQACTKLEKLSIWGEEQPSATVQALLRYLPLLKELIIGIDTLDFAFAKALRNYPSLRSLGLTTHKYTPDFVARYLKKPLPKLSDLTIKAPYGIDKKSRKDKKAERDAEKKGMTIDFYIM